MSLRLLGSLPLWPGSVQVHPIPGAVNVSPSEGITFRLDAEGRWRSIGLKGPILQRTVDGRIVLRHRTRQDSRAVDELPPEEVAAIHDAIRGRIADLLDGVAAGRTSFCPAHETSSIDGAAEILERARVWDAARFEEDRRSFQRIYRPVGILPPDHYRDVVVQPATGCPWNRCHFCTFYRGQPYEVRSIEDFTRHVREVRQFFGRALLLRWGVFLGEANALALPQARLLEVLATVRSELASGGLAPARHEEVGAFFDPHHSPRRVPAEFAELAAAGLHSVAVGVETGCQEVLDLLGKGARVRDSIEGVRAARAGGLRVGVMVLAGPGDAQLAELHRRATVHAIQAMGLSRDDLVFLSPLCRTAGASYAFPVLSEEETEEEALQLRREIAAVTEAKISPYRVEEFQYYS